MWYNSDMTRHRIHTLDNCRAIAATVNSISQLSKQHPAVYNAARRAGWLDKLGLTRKMQPETWTYERIAEMSKQYSTRTEMRQSPHQHAYNIARKQGWWEALPTVIKTEGRHWTLARCQTAAMACRNRREFQWRFRGAYTAVCRNGWFALLGLPPEQSATDADSFYVWCAEGCTFNGLPVFKVGVTSQRLGKTRIQEVAKAAGMTATVVVQVPTKAGDAYLLEDFALALGQDPGLCVADGGTEFRAYSGAELDRVVQRAFFG